jgi:hypothetical protein
MRDIVMFVSGVLAGFLLTTLGANIYVWLLSRHDPKAPDA